MFTGKRVKLTRSILGRDTGGAWSTIPLGATVQVVSGSDERRSRLMTVLWGDREVIVFAADLDAGAMEIAEVAELADSAEA
jgi:hypothetical protein